MALLWPGLALSLVIQRVVLPDNFAPMKRRVISKPFFMRDTALLSVRSSGQILFATWQIASCIFCCTETVLQQKMLAPQGGRKSSEVGLLMESFVR